MSQSSPQTISQQPRIGPPSAERETVLLGPSEGACCPSVWQLTGADRRTCLALLISACVHILVIAGLGQFVWSGASREANAERIDSGWQSETAERDLEMLPQEDLPTLRTPQLDPAASGGATIRRALPPRQLQPRDPSLFSDQAALVDDGTPSAAALGERVPTPLTAMLDRAGFGNGLGRAYGDGEGEDFFGIDVRAQRVVFVVDASGSMNHPHESEAKTRFRRLKFELLKAIGGMTPDMQFFIIFFNEESHPMPARMLQHATPQAVQHYLEWMVGVPATGETDPRRSLSQALRMQPDAIYFLTDGRFRFRVEQELELLRQNRVAIHTFAFGDAEAEPIMKRIAANNGGKYHFVP